jgi:hypothetical protein
MTGRTPMSWRRAVSILWLPACVAILLPVTFQAALHRTTSGKPLVGAYAATVVLESFSWPSR